MTAPSNASASPSSETWFVATDDNGTFELSLSDLTDAIETGRVPFSALVWRAGMRSWLALNEVPLLQLLIARLDLSRLSAAQSSAEVPEQAKPEASKLLEPVPPSLPQPIDFDDDDLTVVGPSHGALMELDDDDLTVVTKFHDESSADDHREHATATAHAAPAKPSDLRPVLVRRIIAVEPPTGPQAAALVASEPFATVPRAAQETPRDTSLAVTTAAKPSLSDRAPPKPQSVPAIPVAAPVADAPHSPVSIEKREAPSAPSLFALAGRSDASASTRVPVFSPPRQTAPALRSTKGPWSSASPSPASHETRAPVAAPVTNPPATIARSRPPLPVRSARPPAEAEHRSMPLVPSASAVTSPVPVAAPGPVVATPVAPQPPSEAVTAPVFIAPPQPPVTVTAPSAPPSTLSPAVAKSNTPRPLETSPVTAAAARSVVHALPQPVAAAEPAVPSPPAFTEALVHDERSGYGTSLAPSVSSITSALRPSRRPIYIAGAAALAVAALVSIFVGSKPTRPSRSVAATKTELAPSREPSEPPSASQASAATPETPVSAARADSEHLQAEASVSAEPTAVAPTKSASADVTLPRTSSKLATTRTDPGQAQASVNKRQPAAKLTDNEAPAAKRARSESEAPPTKGPKKQDTAASVASWDQGTVERRSWMSPGF